MKLLTALLLSLFTPLVFATTPALAATDPFEDVCQNGGGGSSVCAVDGSTDPIAGNDGIITRVANLVAIIGGILGVVMLIAAGAMFVLARGDASRVKIARETIVFTVIGLVILALARAIVAFVIGLT